jgi:DnaJ-class molecular chaperone
MGFFVMIGVIAVAGYLLSLRIHPLTKCRVCNMTGRHFGSVFSGSYRRCRACGGTGRKDRLGAKVFFGGTGDTGVYPKK